MKQKENARVRERLLEVGLEVFAERGYDGATVREICEHAECNIAGINYYFGDKKGFYQSVKEWAVRTRLANLEKIWTLAETDIWAALRLRIEEYLDSTYDPHRFQAHQMFLRDMINNTGTRVEIREEAAMQIQSDYERHTHRFLVLLLGEAATPENMKMLMYTLNSLCLFLPIQAIMEQRYLDRIKESARLSNMDRHSLSLFIEQMVRHAVETMKNTFAQQVRN